MSSIDGVRERSRVRHKVPRVLKPHRICRHERSAAQGHAGCGNQAAGLALPPAAGRRCAPHRPCLIAVCRRMGDRLHAPADDINYATIAVGDVVDYVFSHRSPGYDTFYVCIRRPAQHTFEVRLERRVPPHRKRGGPAPNACVTYVSQAVCQSADEVHQHLREEVPYSSYEATKCGPPTQQQGINPPAVEVSPHARRGAGSVGNPGTGSSAH